MIVPFWSWNLSDTTHVRPHTKFQLVWAINNVFTRGGAQCAPPLTQMGSWDPLTIRVKCFLAYRYRYLGFSAARKVPFNINFNGWRMLRDICVPTINVFSLNKLQIISADCQEKCNLPH